MNYFGIIGGDIRLAKLAEMLAKDNIVNVYGINSEYLKREFNENGLSNIRFSNLEECVSESDFVISSIPFSRDGININSSLYDGKISIQNLIDVLNSKSILFAGQLSEDIQEKLIKKDVRYVDFLEIEELTIKNCILTAEGAIQVAMEETGFCIHDSNVLILGYGRIGKILAHMLTGFGCNIYCEARKESDLGYINAYGYRPIRLAELEKYLDKFDYIFNTIPSMILDSNKLNHVKHDAIIIDLASNPGGVDFEYAKKCGIKAILALSLPGKVAPIASAKYLYEAILGNLYER
jgi:dipicolinate synthase subunit A